MVRCSYLVIYAARAGSYGTANECPINPASRFEQAARGGGRRAPDLYCIHILKTSSCECRSRRAFGSVQVEVAGNDDWTLGVLARDIRQDFLDL